MKILNFKQIREADKYTIINEPVASIDLMERAAKSLYNYITENISKDYLIYVFCGSGNNGGDGLALSRLMYQNGYNNIKVFIIEYSTPSDDFSINLKRLQNINSNCINYIKSENDFPEINNVDIIIDGIFGTGISRPIEGLVKKIIKYLNSSKKNIISIDVPSGLSDNEKLNNVNKESIIKASLTITFEVNKFPLLFKENYIYTGEVVVVPIGLSKEYIDSVDTNNYFVDAKFIKPIVKRRKRFSHKGDYGHGLLIGGSYGKMGALILSAKAALRSGIGLLTVSTAKCGYNILQTSVPEAMITTSTNDCFVDNIQTDYSRYSAIGIGPGLGTEKVTFPVLEKILRTAKCPIVIDADGINIIAQNKNILEEVRFNNQYPLILTPHLKEFERLFGETNGYEDRYNKLITNSKKYNIYIILKGAYTNIACPDKKVYFNSTGNPGMATAGSGDVLTGIILGLLAQGYTAFEASIIGTFIHGLAGDIAAEKISQYSLLASDIIDNIGASYISLLGK